jgi:diaminopimelate dehydrogenase
VHLVKFIFVNSGKFFFTTAKKSAIIYVELYSKASAANLRRYFQMGKLRIGIAGYGNLGRGVELAIRQNDDMELAGIFTRRAPETVKPLTAGAKVYKIDDAEAMKDQIDVLIICGGSATDLPVQTPALAKNFNVIDSFDTHARIPEHFANVDKAAKESGHLAFISLGWDPGLFSLNRLYAESILPNGKSYTFWGKGVSQATPMLSAVLKA